ncbi:unnamed protein product [Candida verbasci]|uniref:4-hydroxyphenylpyruvate dioxygenase n=1 Tax=Candida verbasci TaxID=1227364 RepID=A0A9W4TXV2_9ASCO|nr:unnamed protein product [Candida verbasci]
MTAIALSTKFHSSSSSPLSSNSTINTLDDDSLLKELPYHPTTADNDPLFSFDTDELLSNIHPSTNLPLDGFLNFHSLKIATSNAKTLSKFFVLGFGFEEIAYKGLETGSKLLASHVLRNGSIIIEVTNSLESILNDSQLENFDQEENKSDIIDLISMENYLDKHCDGGVMDVSFLVVDVHSIFTNAVENGAIPVKSPRLIHDSNGAIKIATIGVPNIDIQHTLMENINYNGPYLPNYRSIGTMPQINLPPTCVTVLDHCVENYTFNEMEEQARLYASIFKFHKFWSIDESDINTGHTSLNSVVMSSSNERIKIPINEPVKTKYKSQIEEFNDFNGGNGIQHIALRTNDIINTVMNLKTRGIEFNKVTNKYYENLEARMKEDDIIIEEDFEILKKLNILIDYDIGSKSKKSKRVNYLLQIFTKPLHDKPTLFIEIIQRHHHDGFGKGTFKGLFESIELQQKLRGTFVKTK